MNRKYYLSLIALFIASTTTAASATVKKYSNVSLLRWGYDESTYNVDWAANGGRFENKQIEVKAGKIKILNGTEDEKSTSDIFSGEWQDVVKVVIDRYDSVKFTVKSDRKYRSENNTSYISSNNQKKTIFDSLYGNYTWRIWFDENDQSKDEAQAKEIIETLVGKNLPKYKVKVYGRQGNGAAGNNDGTWKEDKTITMLIPIGEGQFIDHSKISRHEIECILKVEKEGDKSLQMLLERDKETGRISQDEETTQWKFTFSNTGARDAFLKIIDPTNDNGNGPDPPNNDPDKNTHKGYTKQVVVTLSVIVVVVAASIIGYLVYNKKNNATSKSRNPPLPN